jgi:hypothetical protein
VTAAFILLVFFAFAALMYARRMPALLAVPAMAVVMSAVAGVPATGIGTIVVSGTSALAGVYVTVILGAMLGRVTLDTGIAKTIVNFAAEFGGEQPMVVALLLCAIVAVLFVSLSGLGAIIMVGSIVLPIMMTTGVPRKIAATLFLMAFALGFIFNLVNWKFYIQLFGVTQQQMYAYAVTLAAIDALAMVAYAAIAFSKERAYATWAVRAQRRTDSSVPWFALITPVLPIVLFYTLHWDPVISFAASALYGAISTRPSRAVATLVAAAVKGVEDVAPAVVLFIGIGMLLTATKAPQFTAALQPLVASSLFRNPLFFVAIFGLLSPLTLYRGPLNPFGVGIAIFTALLGAHALPPVILVAAVMAVVQVQNVCDPTNTANVWVANYTGVQIAEITRRTLPYQTAVAIAASIAIAIWSPALFGLRPFTAWIASASAAGLPPAGLFVDGAGIDRIAVGTDGSADARIAAATVQSGLDAGSVRSFALQADPNVGDCSRKNYAAYVTVTSTRFALIEGSDLDIGLRLADCGGWIVTEWHDHLVFSQIDATGAQALARQGVSRLHEWAARHPHRWDHLLKEGLAYDDGDPPQYYYSLFKTVDGNMRAYVRAGGPAYDAGMRTNDVVERLDGRFWWEYGTYQTQLRAYDGKTHTFQLQRGNQTLEVALGEPFAP